MELNDLGELRLVVRQVEDDIYSVEFIGQTARSHKYITKNSFHKMLDVFRDYGADSYPQEMESDKDIIEVNGTRLKRLTPFDVFVRMD